MRSFREVAGGLLIAIISTGTVLGGIFLAISESGFPVAAVTLTPSGTPTEQGGPPTLPAPTLTPSQTHTSTATETLAPTETSLPLPTLTLTHTPTLAFTSTPCLPPANWAPYLVQRGDTLFELSRRVGQSVEAIRQANCLTDTALKAGQRLYLPRLASTATAAIIIASATETATPEATATFTPIPPPLQILSITIAGVVRDSSAPDKAIVSVKVEVAGGLPPYTIFEDGALKSGNPYPAVTQCDGTLVHTVQVVAADGQGAQQAYFFSPIVCP